MACRIAMVVKDLKELADGLNAYLKSLKEDKKMGAAIPFFTGNLEDGPSTVGRLLSGRTGETVVRSFVAENNLEKLALYWTQGGTIFRIA